jgi:hypothetical protein
MSIDHTSHKKHELVAGKASHWLLGWGQEDGSALTNQTNWKWRGAHLGRRRGLDVLRSKTAQLRYSFSREESASSTAREYQYHKTRQRKDKRAQQQTQEQKNKQDAELLDHIDVGDSLAPLLDLLPPVDRVRSHHAGKQTLAVRSRRTYSPTLDRERKRERDVTIWSLFQSRLFVVLFLF